MKTKTSNQKSWHGKNGNRIKASGWSCPESKGLHAKEPGPNFREDFDRYPALLQGLERQLCPRVHLKTVLVDGRLAYLGSANLTGVGMRAKSEHRRNFEAGIISDEPDIVSGVMNQFDEIWMGEKWEPTSAANTALIRLFKKMSLLFAG